MRVGVAADHSGCTTPITTLFLDIGGVLLSDGWDHHARQRAAATFEYALVEAEERHHLIFPAYEEGKFTLDEYLSRTVFFKERSFTRCQYRDFMFAQSESYPEMLEFMTELKIKYHLKVGFVSNEAHELNAYRTQKFKLNELADFFISSSFVHLRKPDVEIFRLAIDVAQAPVENILYLDNASLFVEVAESIGIRGLVHTDYESTREKFEAFGLFRTESMSKSQSE